MKILIYLLFSVVQVNHIKLTVPTNQPDIFTNYSNQNFTQRVFTGESQVMVDVKNFNYTYEFLNDRIIPNFTFIQKLHPDIQELIEKLLRNSGDLKDYFDRISDYMKDEIQYHDNGYPQDPASVISSGKANCIGYSNLTSTLLHAAGVRNKIIKGFFLKRNGDQYFHPEPHRWVEVRISKTIRFFFDPQYQNFSEHYIVVKDDVNFTKIRRFEIKIIENTTKLTHM